MFFCIVLFNKSSRGKDETMFPDVYLFVFPLDDTGLKNSLTKKSKNEEESDIKSGSRRIDKKLGKK